MREMLGFCFMRETNDDCSVLKQEKFRLYIGNIFATIDKNDVPEMSVRLTMVSTLDHGKRYFNFNTNIRL